MRAQPVLPRTALLLALAVASCSPSASARSTSGKESASSSGAVATAAAATTASAGPNDSLMARADAARIQGNPNAKVWVIEISDFQCPYCRQWHEEDYGPIKREYVDAGKVRFAYLNYPLAMHRHAMLAAEYAMCAGAQDKFWPMHDALFTTQTTWEGRTDASPVFDSLATRTGVNIDQLHACVQAHVMRPLIQADVDRSTQHGTNSTPTVIVGSEKLVGVAPVDAYRKTIDAAIAAAGQPVKPSPE